MDPSEVNFFAEKYLVTIVPSFAHDALYLISGDVGPFLPSIPLQVPLWMATNLRHRHKCRLVAPDWMAVEVLEKKKQEETESKVFTQMPCNHYMEVAHLVLNCAATDVPRADEIRTLVKDICDLRTAKLRSSIDAFVKSEEVHAKLDHLTVMEINSIRTLLTQSLNQLTRIRKVFLAAAALVRLTEYFVRLWMACRNEWANFDNRESDDQQRLRFQIELEFVQCLANPNYLNFLAQRGYFKEQAFINYLKYLQYWKEPEYAKYLKFPMCLLFLELLQYEHFRKEIVSAQCAKFIDDQQLLHWQHYSRKRMRLLQAQPTDNVQNQTATK